MGETNILFSSHLSGKASIQISDPSREGGWGRLRSGDGAHERDTVSPEMNVSSGKRSKMHLTFYTDSGRC